MLLGSLIIIMRNLQTFTFLLVFVFTNLVAEEKKIKLRSISDNKTFKPIQISISPDLLKIDKVKD